MIKNIIWDFDGTLFDTYPKISSVFVETLSQLGFTTNSSEALSFLHESLSETYEYYSKKFSLEKEVLRNKFMETEERMDVTETLPFKGAAQVLKTIITKGGYNFIYTNRGNSTYSFLEHSNYIGYFKEIVTREDGFGRKPSPDCINYLVKKFSLEKDETLMIGDREIDIMAAVNATIKGCYFNSHHMPIPVKPDIHINSLLELLKHL